MLMQNRIKKFQRQINYHTAINSKLYKAKIELRRIKGMYQNYHLFYLINNNLKVQEIKKELNQWPTVKNHWESTTGLDYIKHKPKLTLVKESMLKNLEGSSMRARKSQHIWRIVQELETARYFHKYVIFNTLTVAPEYYNEVFAKGSTHFKNYIKKFDAIYGKESHTYFGVTEVGEVTGRMHFHVLHVLNTLPTTWRTDINYGMSNPTNRLIPNCQSMWEYGFSKPIAVRFDAFDGYSKLGWRWPVELKEEKFVPIEQTTANKMAFYIAKYITKSLTKKEQKIWRTKIRNKFGLQILEMAIQRMSNQQLMLTIKVAPSMVLRIHQSIIPPYFLLKIAHKNLLLRMRKSKHLEKQLMALTPQPNIFGRLKNLTQPIQSFKRQNSGSFDQKLLRNKDISKLQQYFDEYTKKYTGYVLFDHSLNIKDTSVAYNTAV